MSAPDGIDDETGEIPDRLIASALEFAVGIAAASVRLRPVLPFPSALKPFLRFQKLPAKALVEVRRAVEGDPVFFGRIASVATPELLDEAGVLWLTRPEGWVQRLRTLATVDVSLDLAAELRRSERRREAAEHAAHRSLAEVASLRLEVDRRACENRSLTEQVVAARRAQGQVESEVAGARASIRRTEERLGAADAQCRRLSEEAADAQLRALDAERVRDDVLTQRAGWTARRSSDESILAGAAQIALGLDEQIASVGQIARVLGKLSDELMALEPAVRASDPSLRDAGRRPAGIKSSGRPSRRPIALPGGIYGSSSAAAEFYARLPGVTVLVDGYNVAKLAWPRLELEHQRERCIDACEDVARRFGTNVAVVFDGTLIPGAVAPGRRLVRVQFSAEGVSADDVLRAEVAALPAEVPVVVVTNDQAVANDVRLHGANTMTSQQWLELARR